MRLIPVIAAIAVSSWGTGALADTAADPAALAAGPFPYVIRAPLIEESPDYGVRASGGVTVSYQDMLLSAPEVTGDLRTGDWAATGGATLKQNSSLLRASRVTYNARTRTGNLAQATGRYGVYQFRGEDVTLEPGQLVLIRQAVGSTCDLDHPHWSLTARSLEIHGNSYAVARGLGLRIGRTRIFTLPRYRISLQREASIFPSPGFNRRDGVSMKFNYPLYLPWATAAGAEGRLTQRNGLLTTVEVQRDLRWKGRDGEPVPLASDVPSDFTYLTLLSRTREDRKVRLGLSPEAQAGGPALTREPHLFLRGAVKERVFDPAVRYVYLDRQPEFGLRIPGIPLGSLKSGGENAYIDAQFGYGRFRERGLSPWISRWDARAALRLRSEIGTQWILEPALMARFSNYTSGQNQTILASSIAIGRQVTPRYFVALTYVKHWLRGESPLQFDNLDVKERLASRLDGNWGSTRGSLTLDFDLASGGLYDWGVDIAKAFHCFEPRISYQHRYGSLTASISVIALKG